MTYLQSAYKSGHSCGTTILNVTNDIPPALGAGGCVLLCMLDLSAAFDLVSHDILLVHLQVELVVRQPLGSTLFWGLKFFFQWILFASIPILQNILVGSLSALGNLR